MKPVSQNNILHENKVSSRADTKPTEKKAIPVNVEAELLPQDGDQRCNLCHNGYARDLLESGKFYQLKELALHYFCLLFAEAGEQNGEDDEGLNGFLLVDARALVEKSANLNCFYCHKSGAASRCSAKGCRRLFHFPCGLEADATFQFMGDMDVFCGEHRLKQSLEMLALLPPDYDCVICYDEVGEDVREAERIVVPCCRRRFHRICVQKMALASGKHHAKCPNCNNNKSYVTEIERLGLYIPFADASWETEENSLFYNYGDMYVQEKTCGAEECLCTWEGGRSYCGLGGQFAVVLCKYCGTSGVHVLCGNLDLDRPRYVCRDCTDNQDQVENGEDLVNNEDNQYQVEDREDVVNDEDNLCQVNDREDVVDNEEVNSNGECDEVNDGVIETEVSLVSASVINNIMDITRKEVSEPIKDVSTNVKGEESIPIVDITDTLAVENNLNEVGFNSNEEEVNKSQKDDALEANVDEYNLEIDSAYEDYKDLIIKYRTVSDDKVSSCLKCGFTVSDNQVSDVIKHIKIKHETQAQYSKPSAMIKRSSYHKLVPKPKKLEQIEQVGNNCNNVPDDNVEVVQIDQSKNDSQQCITESDELDNLLKELEEENPVASAKKSKIGPKSRSNNISHCKPPELTGTTTVSNVIHSQNPSHINGITNRFELDYLNISRQINGPIPNYFNEAIPNQITTAIPNQIKRSKVSQKTVVLPYQTNATTPSRINTATPSRSNAATPSRINAATPSRSNAATPSRINAATPSQSNAATPNRINADTPSRINAATPSRSNAATPSQSNAATPNRFNAATPSQSSAATQSQINVATPSQMNVATPSRINVTTPSQINMAIANQINVAIPSQSKHLKRPFVCPVCNSFHKTTVILKLHLANFHFFKKLLNLVFEGNLADPLHVCPEQPCSFTHQSKTTVAQHLARDHDVVFRIARELFPSFVYDQSATLNKTHKIDSDASIIKNLAEVIDLIESPPKSGDTVVAKRSIDDIGNEAKKAKVSEEEPSRKILFPVKKKSCAQTATILPQTRPVQSRPTTATILPLTRLAQNKPAGPQETNLQSEGASLKLVVKPTPTYPMPMPMQRPMRYPMMYPSPMMMMPPWMENTEQLMLPPRQMVNGQIPRQNTPGEMSAPAPPYYMAGGMEPRWIPSPMYRHMWYPS